MGQWFWYNIVDRWEHRAKLKYYQNVRRKIYEKMVCVLLGSEV
jgi:hypothetical protein